MSKIFLFALAFFFMLFAVANLSFGCSDDTFDDGLPHSDTDSDNDSDSDTDSDSDSDTDSYNDDWLCLICG